MELINCMKKLATITNFTCGVIDCNGIVIASTDSKLVGAQEATVIGAQSKVTGETMNIAFQPVTLTGGVDPVVFVQGNGVEAEIVAKMLAGWVATELSSETMENRRMAFLRNTILDNELPADLTIKANRFDIAKEQSRQIIVVRSEENDLTSLLKVLNNIYRNQQGCYVIPVDDAITAVLVPAELTSYEAIEQTSVALYNELSKDYQADITIGVGMPFETLNLAGKSYREALLSLRVGAIFAHNAKIMRYDRLGIGRLISQLPPALCEMFLHEVFLPEMYEALDRETLKTVDAFFANSLNGSETARKLEVHRNTLVYRLDKVQRLTGLDLRSFDDSVLFKIAAMVRQYLEYRETGKTNDITACGKILE